ncbi:MAG: bifunctional diaminohydroxyphosphoribosylaminopyrimidine deaminase/5-amino-6-(5-phosphoribosylamino)uracil reductase RibD [Dysgonamonadaceae bacterium]
MHRISEKYMNRCLQLAKKGEGATKTNPMVGCVIVHNDTIIGEGYHRKFGEAHAEVNAINSVRESSLLKNSTLYVSLEPCSYFGKTPPCAKRIISEQIPRVVIASTDPNSKVAGKGIQMLRDAGIDVVAGVLEAEAKSLNKVFFVNQLKKRPYVILKWAQTKDGFIDNRRESSETPPLKLSNSITQSVVHKLRAQTMSIMVGTDTALKDNPTLTTRKWYGDNPVRVVIDRTGKLAATSNLFSNDAKTILFTQLETYPIEKDNITCIHLNSEDDINRQILNKLFEMNLASVLIEGGTYTLTSFIEKNLWDEAFVEVADMNIGNGIEAPGMALNVINAKKYIDSFHFHIKREISRNYN